jgi:hypothetical protein
MTSANQYPISRTTPFEWTPNYLVYAQYTYAGQITQQTVTLKSSAVLEPLFGMELQVFLAGLENGKVGGTPTSWPPGPGCNCDLGPSALNVQDTSYVVIQLDPSLPWAFAPSVDAITTYFDEGSANFGLQHVGAGGVWQDAPTGSNLAFFCVGRRGGCDMREFNFNVVSTGQGGGAIIVIDPPIGNNGGTPYPPPPPPGSGDY